MSKFHYKEKSEMQKWFQLDNPNYGIEKGIAHIEECYAEIARLQAELSPYPEVAVTPASDIVYQEVGLPIKYEDKIEAGNGKINAEQDEIALRRSKYDKDKYARHFQSMVMQAVCCGLMNPTEWINNYSRCIAMEYSLIPDIYEFCDLVAWDLFNVIHMRKAESWDEVNEWLCPTRSPNKE